jgi:spermidine/putrescine transport system permease protein
MLKKFRATFSSDFSFFMAIPALLWQIIFCFLPLLLIAALSFIDISQLTFTLKHFSSIINHPHFKMIFWSLSLSFFTTLACLLFGYPLAYYIARRIENYKNLFLFFLVIPFWTNLLILVYSWIFILERSGIFNTFLQTLGLIQEPLVILNSMNAVYLVTFYCYLPFMVLPLYNALEKIDPALLEASADLGATPTQTFFKVIVPGTWSGIRTGCFLVFVPVFGEFTIPLLMGGDKYMFVGNCISHYVFTALNLPRGAAFTILSCCALTVGILFLIGLLKLIIKNL